MEKTNSEIETIHITTKGKRGNAIMQYSSLLDDAIANWDGINTVRRIGDKVFVKRCSLHYFIELVKIKANVCLITELIAPIEKD